MGKGGGGVERLGEHRNKMGRSEQEDERDRGDGTGTYKASARGKQVV